MRASADLRLVCTMTEDAVWWLALLARPKWGPAHVLKGVEVAGSPQEAWDRWFLREPSEAMAGRDTALRWLETAGSEGMQVCTLDDPSYPSLLRELTDAPPVLFWRGTWPSEEGWSRSLAVVGTRNCTADMASAAHEVAGDWSFAGGTVVSGLARGIDGQAHRGVLEGPRPHAQVAVMPCALDQVFPRIHEPLARRIEEAGGLLVSEQPPGRQVERWMFAARNRMVTGLSAATVVVQSPARGGSLISARCAHDQDRELYTFHQPQWGVRWAGNRALVVDDMAMPVPDVDALWQAMADHTPWITKRRDHGVRVPGGCVAVWSQVDAVHPRTERALATAAKLPLQDVRRQLFTLELQGWVLRLPGRRYLRR